MDGKNGSGKSLVDIIEYLDKKAKEQVMISLGENGYQDYQKTLNLLDSMENKKEEFVLLSGEINAYLG